MIPKLKTFSLCNQNWTSHKEKKKNPLSKIALNRKFVQRILCQEQVLTDSSIHSDLYNPFFYIYGIL